MAADRCHAMFPSPDAGAIYTFCCPNLCVPPSGDPEGLAFSRIWPSHLRKMRPPATSGCRWCCEAADHMFIALCNPHISSKGKFMFLVPFNLLDPSSRIGSAGHKALCVNWDGEYKLQTVREVGHPSRSLSRA